MTDSNQDPRASKDDPADVAKMDAWLGRVSDALGLDPLLVDAHKWDLLDLIRAISKGPTKPGAPLSTFLIGVAVGQGIDTDDAIDRVSRLVEWWADGQDTATPASED